MMGGGLEGQTRRISELSEYNTVLDKATYTDDDLWGSPFAGSERHLPGRLTGCSAPRYGRKYCNTTTAKR